MLLKKLVGKDGRKEDRRSRENKVIKNKETRGQRAEYEERL